jgi:putative hydrolase of the HAD superfamily
MAEVFCYAQTMLNGSTKFALGQTLLIDADDTLWENNIYFERAIAAFISYLGHHQYTHDEVRQILNEVERENTRLHGYGVASFRRALVTCFERLSAEPVTPERHERIVSFANCITEQEIELLPGVRETLPALAERHRLILMTKGNPEEQSHKLARSGLGEFVTAVEIPHEKNPEAYESVCARYSLLCDTTWMIGNSPPLRHQSRARRRPACCLHPSPQHLGARTRDHRRRTRRSLSIGDRKLRTPRSPLLGRNFRSMSGFPTPSSQHTHWVASNSPRSSADSPPPPGSMPDAPA